MLSLLYFKYRPASRSSVCQTGYSAPAPSKNILISRFRALISPAAFIAWSLAQIFHYTVQLCVAHHNKDDIVTILRFKLCDNRDAAYALPQMKDLFNL